MIQLTLNGQQVEFPDAGDTLLGALRDNFGLVGPKDGCSPQGQCGCCTVLVDGQPRVACVTPARRVKGRQVTTIEGINPEAKQRWAQSFCATGGSQCGFCTPGIVIRLDALRSKPTDPEDEAAVHQALLAHMCRCTGWQTITEAWQRFHSDSDFDDRDYVAASRRATLEGGANQSVSPEVALGLGGFAADTAPPDALIAVLDHEGIWHTGESLALARSSAGKTQGRRTTIEPTWPVELPEGDWVATLKTTWVEPAYLETDASWCEPGGEPAPVLANGGAFGAKHRSPVMAAAKQLAEKHGRTVLALASREDTVRLGPKRPPVGGGIAADGTGVLRVAYDGDLPAETLASVHRVAPGLVVETVQVAGPQTSVDIRCAVWAEAHVLAAAVSPDSVRAPSGATASAEFTADGIRVAVRCGEVLDEIVLRSYCIGAAHMALSWVQSESLAIDESGEIHDLTVRSFGVLRAQDTPHIEVTIEPTNGPAINGSDAVFAAVAAAVSAKQSQSGSHRWPTGAMITP